MKDFEALLRQEIADLEGELEQDPRWRKLVKLRSTLEEYDGDGGATVSLSVRSVPRAVIGRPMGAVRPMGRQPSEARVLAVQATEEFLRGRVEPTKTKEIYDHLVSVGVQIGGKEPASNLSAMLYHSKRFTSHGRAGWTLPGVGEEQAPGSSEVAEPGIQGSNKTFHTPELPPGAGRTIEPDSVIAQREADELEEWT